MRAWQEKDLKFINNPEYFPNCIECSEHYLDNKQHNFFHKEGCLRGLTDWSTTNKRFDERLEIFEKRHGVNGCKIKCRDCSNFATGTMNVFYHHSDTVIEEWPVCSDHAFYEDDDGRDTQFRSF